MMIIPKFLTRHVKAKKIFLCLFCVVYSVGAVNIARAQNSPVYATNNNAAQTEIRMQQLETQIRDLTGKVENQRYEINSLNQKIKMLEGKAEAAVSKNSSATPLPRSQSVEVNSTSMQPSFVEPEVISSKRMGASVENNFPPMPNTEAANTLGLDFTAHEPKGIQTKTVIGGGDAGATSQYEKAYADLKLANYDKDQQGFEDFLRAHDDHVLAANAQYWLGESFYVRDDFQQAARAFAQGFQTYPDSAKSPDILLKLGLSLKGLGKNREACVALGQLPVKFPIGHDGILERAKQERQNLSCGV